MTKGFRQSLRHIELLHRFFTKLASVGTAGLFMAEPMAGVKMRKALAATPFRHEMFVKS